MSVALKPSDHAHVFDGQSGDAVGISRGGQADTVTTAQFGRADELAS